MKNPKQQEKILQSLAAEGVFNVEGFLVTSPRYRPQHALQSNGTLDDRDLEPFYRIAVKGMKTRALRALVKAGQQALAAGHKYEPPTHVLLHRLASQKSKFNQPFQK